MAVIGLVLKYLTQEVNSATLRFQDAIDDEVDIAIYELMVAELKLNKYIKEIKSIEGR